MAGCGTEVVSALIDLLYEDSATTRRHAAYALSAIGAPAVEALGAALSRTDPVARTDAATILGDIALAEPGARIGFAGQTVIQQFLGTDDPLPEGFQVAETVLEHGFIDRIVPRDRMATELTQLIALLASTDGQSPQAQTA